MQAGRGANGHRFAVERRALPEKPSQAKPAAPEALTARVIAGRILALRSRVRALMVYDRFPDRFHEEKGEICKDLGELAREVERS